jgi:DNA-binding FadR family transcriptional regulator
MADPASAQRHTPNRVIQDRIKRFIIDEGFHPGDMLPPEGEIARSLGVSRPALREAIKALQPLGVIETRHGTGTFVGHFSLESLIDGLAFSIIIDQGERVRTMRELLALRETLEHVFVGEVARLPNDPQHLRDLRVFVDEMTERAERVDPSLEPDRAFHETLYRPLGNTLLVSFLQAFWDVFHRVRGRLLHDRALMLTTADDHARIVDAIEAGDAAAASAAMSHHFYGVKAWLDEQALLSAHNAATVPEGTSSAASG